MSVFAIQIYKSFGGRSSRFGWSNTYHVNAQTAINGTILRDIARHYVDAEVAAHYDAVHFMRAHITQVRSDLINVGTNDFVTMELSDRGARLLQGELSPIEVVLEVKRDTETGRAGALFYRGCLAGPDLVNSADNTFQLATPATFDGAGTGSNTLIDWLNADLPGGVAVLPVHGINPINTYRAIIAHRLGGVGIRQVGRRTRSVDSAVEAAAQRRANLLARRARKALGNDLISSLSGDKLALLRSLLDAFYVLRGQLPVEARSRLELPFPLNLLPVG